MKKKKMFYGAIICAAAIMSVFYACKKNESSSSASNPATPLAGQASNRTAGVVTYYSKKSDGTVYEMVLTTNEEGKVDIDRKVYPTNRPDTFKVKTYAGEGVTFVGYERNVTLAVQLGLDTTSLFADTLYVDVPPGKTYFLIPFDPGVEPQAKYTQTKYYCQCGCSDCASMGSYGCIKNGDDYSNECLGVCEDCKAIAECGYPSLREVPNIGGLVIIDANGINVIN